MPVKSQGCQPIPRHSSPSMRDASPFPAIPAPSQGRQPVLTQPADGAVVGLVAQGVSTRVAEAEVAAGQDERVPHVRQAHHALRAVVTHLVLGHLPMAHMGPARAQGPQPIGTRVGAPGASFLCPCA